MSIRQYINSKFRRPTARVFIEGKQVRVVDAPGAVTLAQSFGQPIGGGTVRLANPDYYVPHKASIIIEWGYNGFNVPAFMGFVTNPTRQAYPKNQVLQIRDILWIADFTTEDKDITLHNTTHTLYGTPPTDYFGTPNWIKASEVIIRLLRDWAGIPPSRLLIPELYTDEARTQPWYLGKLTPITFTGSSPLQACLQIASTLGYWLFCDPAGMVRMVQMSGAPTEAMSYVWREGENLLISGAPSIDANIDNVYNRILVLGAATGVEGVQVRDSWAVITPLLPDGKHRTMTVQNQLIEYVNEAQSGLVSCTGVARRYSREYSRLPRTISGTVKAVPTLTVGASVGIRSTRIGIPNDTPFFLYGLQTSFGGGVFHSQISLDGGIGEDGYTLIPPPTAGFTWRLMKETLVDGDYIEVFVDGNASLALGGAEIVTWSWVDDSIPPQTAEGVQAVFIYKVSDTDGTVNITLTVTDTSSKQGSVTLAIPLAGDALQVPATRELNIAAQTMWYVTPDTGKTWYNANVGQTWAVPPIGSAGSIDADQTVASTVGLLATGGSGHNILYSSIDRLVTPPIAKATLPGGINFIWQHEKNPLRLWVAMDEGVALSVDGGITFAATRKPTLPDEAPEDDTCRWIVESKDSEGIIDVLIGRYVYTSFDSGITWVLALEGPAGSIARCYTAGFERHWVGYTNLPPGSSPLRSTEGDTATWPVDTTPTVTAVRAITMMVNYPLLISIDSQGRIWKHNVEDGGETVLSTTLPEVI